METLLFIVLVMGFAAELLTHRRIGVFAQIPSHWSHLFGAVAWLSSGAVVFLLMSKTGSMSPHYSRVLAISVIATLVLGAIAIRMKLVSKLGLYQTAVLTGALALLIGLSI